MQMSRITQDLSSGVLVSSSALVLQVDTYYTIYNIYIISNILLFTISITIISTLSTRCAAGRGEDLRRAVHLHRLQHRGRHHEQLQDPHRQMLVGFGN